MWQLYIESVGTDDAQLNEPTEWNQVLAFLLSPKQSGKGFHQEVVNKLVK